MKTIFLGERNERLYLNDAQILILLRFLLDHRPVGHEVPSLPRRASTAEFHPVGENQQVEYFFASDASAIIEHTNRVIFLEVNVKFTILMLNPVI